MDKIITSLRLEIPAVPAEIEAQIVERMMRPQQAAVRMAYQRIKDNWTEKNIYHLLRDKFPLLSGFGVNGAIVQAKGVSESQKALLQAEHTYVTKRVEKLTTKAHRNPNLLRKLDTMKARLQEVKDHLDNGSTSTAIFGGRKLWNQVVRKTPGASEQWKFARSSQFLAIGGSSKFGNRHIRIELADQIGKAHLLVQIPGNTPDEKAIWVALPACYTRNRYALMKTLTTGISYTVRLERVSNGHMRAWVTISEMVMGKLLAGREPLPKSLNRAAGIDLNLDHLAVALVDGFGQYRGSSILNYPNLGELPREKSSLKIGEIANALIMKLKQSGVEAIVLEDLNIKRSLDATSVYNRRTVPFAYRQLNSAIVRRALREGLVVRLVNPAYTSKIGYLKYQYRFGISRHQAAAYVIARRGLNLVERMPKGITKKFQSLASLASEKDQEALTNWKSISPSEQHPWMLWALLMRVIKNSQRDAEAILARGTTDGRNDMRFQRSSAGNTRSGAAPPDSRSGQNSPRIVSDIERLCGHTPGRGTRPPALQT